MWRNFFLAAAVLLFSAHGDASADSASPSLAAIHREAQVSVTINPPTGPAKSYVVAIEQGMTLEDVMQIASGGTPPFKWKAVWFEAFWSYQVVEIDGTANEPYVDENSKSWMFCAGPAGYEERATRGISLYGVAPNDRFVWKYSSFGGLSCP